MRDNQQDAFGYEGTDEYVPNGADAYEINKDAPRVRFDGNGSSQIRIARWTRSCALSASRRALRTSRWPA